MSMINDKVTQKLIRSGVPHSQIISLRYGPDYGHGFLGLFKALFEGRLEEVLNDPGPPFVDKKHYPVIMRTLLQLAHESQSRNKIPQKYASYLKDLSPIKVSRDTLFL